MKTGKTDTEDKGDSTKKEQKGLKTNGIFKEWQIRVVKEYKEMYLEH